MLKILDLLHSSGATLTLYRPIYQ